MKNIRQFLDNSRLDSIPHNHEMLDHLSKLNVIFKNAVVLAAFDEAIANIYPVTSTNEKNPWAGSTYIEFLDFFEAWFVSLPRANDGLGFIYMFSTLYNNNYSAFHFLNEFKSNVLSDKYTKEIFHWLTEFIMIRGRFMDSSDSAPVELMNEWMAEESIKIEDYEIPLGGFKSFNEFFTRSLDKSKNPRPISDPNDESVVVAPADATVNKILSNLTLKSELKVKTRNLSVEKLLGYSEFASCFVGGTAISCVLLPNVYHHFHSPVSGKIIDSGDIPGIHNGILDGNNWFNDLSNIGQGDTRFSIFEEFHRAFYIIETKNHGNVAVVPVGLNTISRICRSVQLDSHFFKQKDPVFVEKGDRLGNFAYGGSLVILMFEKDIFPCVSLKVGDRIGQMKRKR